MRVAVVEIAIAATLFVAGVAPASGRSFNPRFEARKFTDARGKTMPYRLFVPDGYVPSVKYPVIVWLHGVDSVGNDNVKQISGQSYTGANVWTEPVVQRRYHPFVIAPQLRRGGLWATPFTRSPTADLLDVLAILEIVRGEFSIDEDRIYVVGQSLGGYGTWSVAADRPDLFAAAIPICGGGNVRQADNLSTIPIWAFHSTFDVIVPVIESRIMVSAVRKAGGTVNYTEFHSLRHDIWNRALRDPEVIDWLFLQRRRSDSQIQTVRFR